IHANDEIFHAERFLPNEILVDGCMYVRWRLVSWQNNGERHIYGPQGQCMRTISRLDLWMEMVPIGVSVGRPGPTPSLDLKPSEFDPLEKYWTGFPIEGSKITFPRPSCEFR
ncbi:hypothetical protein EJD97_020264, partial [Solanum chilense]